MSSSESVEPLSFFSLPRELRDKIVSLKGANQDNIRVSFADRSPYSEQYDILHQLQDEVEFGINGQLVARFPPPRLHHISRWFTEECGSRAPSQQLIVVSQKHGDFVISTLVNGKQHVERAACPRIVNLRHTQSQHLFKTLHINMYARNATEGVAEDTDALLSSMVFRIAWIKGFVQDIGSLGIGVQIRVRFMLNDVREIDKVKRIPSLPPLVTGGTVVEVVLDCPSEQEYHEEEFSRAKTLAVSHPGFGWEFDEQEIRRCRALAEGQSDWSTGATSPKSSRDEEIDDYQEFDGLDGLDDLDQLEEITTDERLGEQEGAS